MFDMTGHGQQICVYNSECLQVSSLQGIPSCVHAFLKNTNTLEFVTYPILCQKRFVVVNLGVMHTK